MARTKLSEVLSYRDGSGENQKIRVIDVENFEKDLKCFTNRTAMAILKELSIGMKVKSEFFSYFPRENKSTFHNALRLLKSRGIVKMDRVDTRMHYMLNIKKLNEIEAAISLKEED